VLLRVSEHLPHDSRRLSNVLVDDGGGDDLEEVGRESCGDSSREERLARSRGSIEQDTYKTTPSAAVQERRRSELTLGRLDSHTNEQLRVHEWQLNDLFPRVSNHATSQAQYAHLSQLPDLVSESSNTSERSTIGILHTHAVHERVDLPRQYPTLSHQLATQLTEERRRQVPHDGESRHIKGYTHTRLELRLRHTRSASYNVTRTRRCFHNDYIPHTVSAQCTVERGEG
jgi:hypothetical protein